MFQAYTMGKFYICDGKYSGAVEKIQQTTSEYTNLRSVLRVKVRVPPCEPIVAAVPKIRLP
jgi:hypothetical protein